MIIVRTNQSGIARSKGSTPHKSLPNRATSVKIITFNCNPNKHTITFKNAPNTNLQILTFAPVIAVQTGNISAFILLQISFGIVTGVISGVEYVTTVVG